MSQGPSQAPLLLQVPYVHSLNGSYSAGGYGDPTFTFSELWVLSEAVALVQPFVNKAWHCWSGEVQVHPVAGP